MPRTITESEMESRQRIAALASRITECIGLSIGELTYVEVINALNQVEARMIGHMQVDEWKESK